MRGPATSNRQPATCSRGFTMVELLTVITIIVLMLAVSVPLVRSVQGNRTVEVGYNTISAALGHARQIALYYRAPAGVAFYRDPVNGYQDIAYVMQEKNIPQDVTLFAGNPSAYPQDDRYMDIIPGEQLTSLPQGLAVQVFNGNGANMPAVAAGTAEKYLRVGIVLFNEDGQLANLPYWVRALTVSGQNHLGDASHLNLKASLNPSAIPPAAGPTLYSHAAVCLYDEDSYVGQTAAATSDPFSDDDSNSYNYGNYFPATAPPANPLADKAVEQNWLDQNGEVLVIKPNDGSLLRNK